MPTPTAAASTKPTSVAPRLNVPNTNAPTAARYRIRAVASFTRLSPSRIVATRRGTPRAPTTATADTASGGDTIAPSATAPDQLRPRIRECAQSATATVVATTSPTASKVIGRALLLKS